MVMKAQPFHSTDHQDKNYSILAKGDTEAFWKIFAGCCKPSHEFKGKNLIYIKI